MNSSDDNALLNENENILAENKRFLAKNKKRFGAFWALYFLGISSIWNIKYTIIDMIVQMATNTITVFLINKIVSEAVSLSTDSLVNMIIIMAFINILTAIINHFVKAKTFGENNKIATKITNFVIDSFAKASYVWKQSNPSSEQLRAITNANDVYSSMTFGMTYSIIKSIDACSTLVIILYTDWHIFLCIIASTYVLLIFQQYINSSFLKEEEEYAEKDRNIKLRISNQFSNRYDVENNTMFINTVFKKKHFNPVIGFNERFEFNTGRNISLSYVDNTVKIATTIFKTVLFLYTIWNKKYALLIILLMRESNIFGVVTIITHMQSYKSSQLGKIASCITMLDKIDNPFGKEEKKVNKNNEEEQKENLQSVLIDINDEKKNIDNEKFEEYTSPPISEISIKNLKKEVWDKVLSFGGDINIKINDDSNRKCKVILLDGKNGTGKSTTMGIIAGKYDNEVSDQFIVDGNLRPNGFKSIKKSRIYMSQILSVSYRNNSKNTLTLSLKDLFPNASMDEIVKFLIPFNVYDKISRLKLEDQLSKNEDGLSPGQLQAFLLASKMYNAIRMKTPILLLDEPEQHIDIGTMKDIFLNFLAEYNGVIFLIAHTNELKEFIMQHNSLYQTWNYADKNGNRMTFTITEHFA
jgi:ABC-type multidrug transport system fused ATPase/permease subunit